MSSRSGRTACLSSAAKSNSSCSRWIRRTKPAAVKGTSRCRHWRNASTLLPGHRCRTSKANSARFWWARSSTSHRTAWTTKAWFAWVCSIATTKKSRRLRLIPSFHCFKKVERLSINLSAVKTKTGRSLFPSYLPRQRSSQIRAVSPLFTTKRSAISSAQYLTKSLVLMKRKMRFWNLFSEMPAKFSTKHSLRRWSTRKRLGGPSLQMIFARECSQLPMWPPSISEWAKEVS